MNINIQARNLFNSKTLSKICDPIQNGRFTLKRWRVKRIPSLELKNKTQQPLKENSVQNFSYEKNMSLRALLAQEEQNDPFLEFLELRLSPIPPWIRGE